MAGNNCACLLLQIEKNLFFLLLNNNIIYIYLSTYVEVLKTNSLDI